MSIKTRLCAVTGPMLSTALTAEADAVAVPISPGPAVSVADGLHADAGEFHDLVPISVAALLAHHEAKGEPGEVISAPVSLLPDRVTDLLFYGVGDASPAALRRAGAALARRCKGRTILVAAVPAGAADEALAAFAEGALLACYAFRVSARPANRDPVAEIAVVTDREAVLARADVIARAAALARDLANIPSAEKCPAWLADRARELAEPAGLTARIRGEVELTAEGFGGLVAVGSGSNRPPRLIELSYRPEDRAGPAVPGAGGTDTGDRHVVVIGKGITFDSGGLSLKSTDNMKTMKTDMAAGGVVIAVMSALRSLGVRTRVTGLVAAAENMPSGSSMRPGDVIKHYGGRTSEVLNTDAEGRLVLADALAYADAALNPDVVIDVATLTGAARIALGLRHAALYTADDALAESLLAAGKSSGESLWRMPLVEDYREGIDSAVADVANIEQGGFGAGSIMAALFLREFVGARRWAHLDIAGPARSTSDDGEITKGATGFGVRLLLDWLSAQDKP